MGDNWKCSKESWLRFQLDYTETTKCLQISSETQNRTSSVDAIAIWRTHWLRCYSIWKKGTENDLTSLRRPSVLAMRMNMANIIYPAPRWNLRSVSGIFINMWIFAQYSIWGGLGLPCYWHVWYCPNNRGDTAAVVQWPFSAYMLTHDVIESNWTIEQYVLLWYIISWFVSVWNALIQSNEYRVVQ